MKARLFTDGGARGNPGPAAFGYVLEAEDGTVLGDYTATGYMPSFMDELITRGLIKKGGPYL